MPKKENSKAVEARSRKEETKKAVNAKQQAQAEDQAWAEAGDGAKSKAQAKKEDQAKSREEAAAKKAEARRLADEEAASLATSSKAAKQKATPSKVTSHQLALQKEADRKAKDAAHVDAKKADKREVSEDAYEALVAVPNINREADEASARTVGDAISLLSVEDGGPAEDRHPERRAKAAFAAFSERELPQLKQDRPGLKQSQYKDALWKLWQKSADNPFNRAAG